MWFRPPFGLSRLAPMARGEPGSQHTGGSISIVGLRKEFDGVTAVDGIDLEIEPGEFFTLLGPSGCGKTTTLRMLAGFEQPTDGQIFIDGVDVAQTPAHKRPVNTVFQSYALFPHLDVERNVAYGLRWRKDLDKQARASRVAKALDLVQLSGYGKRRPHQLSGGQQQRVALARALVLEPAVLLLDEPLGALDAKLRHSLRAELTGLQREIGITFVFVTHDQEEALEMSNRLVVMDGGRIMQLGSPEEVYREPRTEFVADFLGVANLLDIECLADSGSVRTIRYGEFTLDAQVPPGRDAGPGRAVIRPECVELAEAGLTGTNRLPGMVDRTVFLGSTTQVLVRLPQGGVVQSLITNTAGSESFAAGQPVTVSLPSEALHVLAASPDQHVAYAETG
jgi:spermidine/putrescine transport system ATP-binding protein